MAFVALEESGGGRFTPLEEEDSTLEKAGKSIVKGAVATGTALGDIATGVPTWLGSLLTSNIAIALGDDPTGARDTARETVGKYSFSNLAGISPEVTESPGYRVPMYPFELADKAIEGTGDYITEKTGSSDAGALSKQMLDVGSLALGFKAKPILNKFGEATTPRVDPDVARVDKGYEARQDPSGMGETPILNDIEPPPAAPITEVPTRSEPFLGAEPEVRPYIDPAMREVTISDRPEPPMERAKTEEELALEKAQDALNIKEAVVDPLTKEKLFEKPEKWSGDRAELEFTPFEKNTARIEKQSAEGPVLGKRTTVINDAVIQDITQNPALLQDYVPNQGIDYWSSTLEDLHLPTEKAVKNRTLQYKLRQSEQQHSYIQELLDKRRPVPEIKKEIEVYENLQEGISTQMEKIYGEPLTRRLYPENISPMGKKQRGSVNPNVFAEGFESVKKIPEKGIELLSRFVPFERGSKDGYLMVEARDASGKRVAGATFEKSRQGYDLKDTDLSSQAVGVRLEARGNRISEEIYKYVSELGNDIVPSKVLTEEGRKMWEGFESRGVSQSRRINRGPGGKQSGAIDAKVFIEGLKKGSKSLEDFTKKLVDELGEEFRPLAAALYNQGKEKVQEEPKVAEKPIPSKVGTDLRKYDIADTRTAEEFVTQEITNSHNWKDIKDIWTNFLPGSNIATLAKDFPPIKWVVDRALIHDRQTRVDKENAKYGAMFAPKRGIGAAKWNRRLRSDDGALTGLERLSVDQANQAKKIWIEKYDGQDIPMTAESLKTDGLNQSQIKAVLAARKQLDIFFDKYNKAAQEQGFAPLRKIPNYFPHMWNGDYRIFAKSLEYIDHETGKVVPEQTFWAEGASTKKEAIEIAKELQRRFPDYKVEWKETKSKYDIKDTSAFRESINMLDKDDPARAILQKTFNDILAKRGFRTHNIQREGTPGFLGVKEGKEGVRDAIDAVGQYLDKGYNFLGNQRKKADLANLYQMSKDYGVDLDSYKNASNYMKAFLDNSSGSVMSGLQAIDAAVEMVGSKTGVGKSAGSNVLGALNGTASAWWLTTPRFVIAQLVQPLYNLPKGLQLKAEGLTDKSVSKAFGQAYLEAFTTPSKKTIEGMNWAKENGFIDSKILDLMGAKFDSKAKTASIAFQLFSKYGLGKIEQEAVRSPTFIFYDLLLRDTIKDDKARWTAAGMLTDKYMVDYTLTDAPLIYGKMGIVGEAAKPLKQFQHAYYGQMLEYLQSVKNQKNITPIASFVGIQALMAGLKGTIFVAEAALIITAINNLFGTTIPTPEEYLITSGASDLLVFGGVSTATGLIPGGPIDVSATLGAPQLEQVTGLPGLSFGGKAAMEVGELGIAAAKGTTKESDKMSALQAIVPNIAQGAVEQAFTAEGEGPPNPRNRMISDLDPRTEQDVQARYMGARSLKESRQMIQNRVYKAAEVRRKEQLKSSMDLVLDRILTTGEVPDTVIEKWVSKGGNPKQLDEAIVNYYKDKAMSFAERELGKTKGLSRAQKAERLKEFNMILQETNNQNDLLAIIRELK